MKRTISLEKKGHCCYDNPYWYDKKVQLKIVYYL